MMRRCAGRDHLVSAGTESVTRNKALYRKRQARCCGTAGNQDSGGGRNPTQLSSPGSCRSTTRNSGAGRGKNPVCRSLSTRRQNNCHDHLARSTTANLLTQLTPRGTHPAPSPCLPLPSVAAALPAQVCHLLGENQHRKRTPTDVHESAAIQFCSN